MYIYIIMLQDFCDSPVFCKNREYEDDTDGISNIPAFVSALTIITREKHRFKKVSIYSKVRHLSAIYSFSKIYYNLWTLLIQYVY